jgi:hypothetical protein
MMKDVMDTTGDIVESYDVNTWMNEMIDQTKDQIKQESQDEATEDSMKSEEGLEDSEAMKELKNAYSQGFANRGFNRKSARDQHDHN